MDHAQQLRHALGVLAQALALRSALAQTPEDDTVTIHWFLRLCCKLNLRHAWEVRYTDDNELFNECDAVRSYLLPGSDNRLVHVGLAPPSSSEACTTRATPAR